MKTCTKCYTTKLLSEYGKNKQRNSGLHTWCKSCRNLNTKHWRSLNKEKIKKENKNYRLTNPNVYKASKLKTKFGISLDEYNSMLSIQDRSCAICKTNQSNLKRCLAVDHNHSTNKIRGLLCNLCNLGIGYFKDSPELLVDAITYLSKNNK